MRSEFDLHILPAHERFDFWRDVSQSLHVPVNVGCDRPLAFSARYDGRYMGPFMAGSAAMSAEQKISRTPAHIRKSSGDMIGIWFPLSGSMKMQQDGREAHIRPGEFGVVDPLRPYEEVTSAGFNFLWLHMPRESVEAGIGATRSITGTAFASTEPHARLAINYVYSLSKVWNELEGAAAERAATHASTLLALAFHRLPTMAAPRKYVVDPAVQLLRVRSFVNAHLADRMLSSSMTGAALGMTSSEVEDVLRWHETDFAQFLLSVRLNRCAQALADARYNGYSAKEIARMSGLASAEQFCAAFAAAYGVAPNAYRSMNQAPGRQP